MPSQLEEGNLPHANDLESWNRVFCDENSSPYLSQIIQLDQVSHNHHRHPIAVAIAIPSLSPSPSPPPPPPPPSSSPSPSPSSSPSPSRSLRHTYGQVTTRCALCHADSLLGEELLLRPCTATWLYALFLKLDKPLLPDVASTLRNMFRSLAAIRAQTVR